MILYFTCSSDTYITNKIINNNTRATDANVGNASTLDLFKLYDESSIVGESTPIELSRVLLGFNFADISSSLSSKTEFDQSSFKATLELFDVQGTQVAPNQFNLIAYPLSKSFDEGIGYDISSFSDLGRANWVTSSYLGGVNSTWDSTGAQAEGYLNSNDIDIISSGSIAGSSVYLYSSQYFSKGNEDLSMDITTSFSASLCGILPQIGYLLAFSGSEQTDSKTRFVKRFASRHTRNPYIRPRIKVEFDDSELDNHLNFEFNTTGSLFLKSHSYNSPSNITSGSSVTPITGSNSLLVRISTGSYGKEIYAGQQNLLGKHVTGVYTASFAIDGFLSNSIGDDGTVAEFVAASGSITFGEQWLSLDKTVEYFSGSITIKKSDNLISNQARKLKFNVIDLRNSYKQGDTAVIRFFITDINRYRNKVRQPLQLPSIVLQELYYRIKDADNGRIIIPFAKKNSTNATRVSSDATGNYFKLDTGYLIAGRNYTIDIMVVDRNNTYIVETKERFGVFV